MRLILDARRETGSSLCVLGAGNGNDIELGELSNAFENISLVDLDQQALDRLSTATPRNERPGIQYCGGIDVTGMVTELASLDGAIANSDLKATIEKAATSERPQIGTFDVVCSTCLLTQIIDSVCMALPADHPQLVDLIMAMRNRHLSLIVELLNAGGTGILVTDFVSTTTAPELATLDDTQLPKAAFRWISERNFFTGTNPFILREHYGTNPAIAHLVQSTHLTRPWRWDIGDKQFAVCAVVIQRKAK
jgi:hypothetical protein